MVQWLPAVRYPPAQKGYWEPITSTINWCEEDYYATIYSAEIVNTLTNLLFIGLGIRGFRNVLKYGHDKIYLVAFAGYMLVGTGSFFFHSTLKYPMQLMDELSMIYVTEIMCYSTFSLHSSRRFSIFLGLGLAALGAFITLYYHYLQDPLFHQNAYALLTATVLFRSMYVMEVNLRPSLRAKYGTITPKPIPSSTTKAEIADMQQRDKKILKDMWWMIGIGLSIFLGGFGIWNLDNFYCSTIRRWRHEVGLPWGILLEGHGWWHLMTGTGAYFYLVWGIWLRHCLNERQDEYELSWPSIFSLPDIVPSKSLQARQGNAKSNGYGKGRSKKSNGHAKKTL